MIFHIETSFDLTTTIKVLLRGFTSEGSKGLSLDGMLNK